jgi:outer membrane protein assembly factor BamB
MLRPSATWRISAVIVLLLTLPAAAIDWPEWLGSNREGVWRESGLVTKFPDGGPKVLWRTPLGTGYSGPAVAEGRVYVMDRQLTPGVKPERKPSGRVATAGTERVVCLDATTGKEIWKHEYDCPYSLSYPSGPRNTPLIRDGRVYVLGAMGHFMCLNAADGSVRWQKNLAEQYKTEPPVWGFTAHPLLDGNLLYTLVGGDGSAVVAFNKDTGDEVWKGLDSEEVGYSPPIMVEAGGQRQLIIWLSETINGLDPATGKKLWSYDYPEDGAPQRPAVSIVTPRQLGDTLFVSTVYHGPLMLKFAAGKTTPEVLYRDKSKSPRKLEGLHCLMASPVLHDGHIYGSCANGEIKCCEAATGKQLWDTFAPVGGKKTDCGTVFIVPHEDRYVMFNDSGELILANMSPKGYTEIDRAKIIEPIEAARGRLVVWSHPAFANKCVFVRNDKEIVCVSLAQG